MQAAAWQFQELLAQKGMQLICQAVPGVDDNFLDSDRSSDSEAVEVPQHTNSVMVMPMTDALVLQSCSKFMKSKGFFDGSYSELLMLSKVFASNAVGAEKSNMLEDVY